jgi:hypothetical protein
MAPDSTGTRVAGGASRLAASLLQQEMVPRTKDQRHCQVKHCSSQQGLSEGRSCVKDEFYSGAYKLFSPGGEREGKLGWPKGLRCFSQSLASVYARGTRSNMSVSRLRLVEWLQW